MSVPEAYLRVTEAEWTKALAYGREHDVESGGVFDARMLAINVWSKPWRRTGDRESSRLLVTFYPRFRREPCFICETIGPGLCEMH